MKDEESRFAFGENWQRFLRQLSDERIALAEESLQKNLGVESLAGKTFIDIGSGSGLFSLAARRLGAKVHSFDYDTESVACTKELKRRYFPDDGSWTVEQGSILDEAYVSRLGRFDIVYSWGVLHHTGDLWRAMREAVSLAADDGILYLALYNDQGRPSGRWTRVKQAYNALPGYLRFLVVIPAFVRLWGPTFVRDGLKGNPLRSWRSYETSSLRGMDAWTDVIDWVGGYPFEVSTPEQVVDFCVERGFVLTKIRTAGGGLGCNEFVFVRGRARE
jgi:2-polyprenyl-6-hydroxyphenyl methylase/3-demethylubiquinone-9 3-methyltransferase